MSWCKTPQTGHIQESLQSFLMHIRNLAETIWYELISSSLKNPYYSVTHLEEKVLYLHIWNP